MTQRTTVGSITGFALADEALAADPQAELAALNRMLGGPLVGN
jgi:hypothetical protein